VLVAQGDLPGALAAYRTGLGIMETLAARDAGNMGWQRDLSVSHEKIGDVLVAQGDLPGALSAFRKDLEIAETLAARDAGNTDWQRDRSISLGRVADILIQEQKSKEARPLAERALTLVRAAIARFSDDPRLARDLPYYENLLRRAGGDPARQ
jgi:tetratricopeptide (TPR) repeat protein